MLLSRLSFDDGQHNFNTSIRYRNNKQESAEMKGEYSPGKYTIPFCCVVVDVSGVCMPSMLSYHGWAVF